MIKKTSFILKIIFPFTIAVICLLCTLIYPKEIGSGVKDGIFLLGDSLIPSLFPFAVLSTYIAVCPATEYLSELLKKPSHVIFGVSDCGLLAVILGFLGGYPIGAKIVCKLYECKKISQKEAHLLFCWCVNPGISFVITAIGQFMLKNTFYGVVLYISVVLSSVTIGVFSRFIYKVELSETNSALKINNENLFIDSVASGSKTMLSICGWVLLFSAISGGVDALIKNRYASLFIKALLEVTTGCKYAALNNLSLPLISALLSFGGFAVIFQVSPFLQKCKCKIKYFIATRVVNASLSAFYCSVILKISNLSAETAVTLWVGSSHVQLSHSIGASIILILTCIVLILEVDYKKKVC